MEKENKRKDILFLCSANSCRSQMAEGFARHLHGDKYEVFSAGTEAGGINPYAVKVMDEVGVNINGQKSNEVSHYADRNFDAVITVCDRAKDKCPIFYNCSGGECEIKNWNFQDPASATGTEEEVLEIFRKVRDSIKEKIESEL